MSFYDKFPEDMRFNIGDKVIAHPESMTARDYKYLKALADAKTPYLIVSGLKESWLMFSEPSMRESSFDDGPNSWNPRYWLPYEPVYHLDEELFTL